MPIDRDEGEMSWVESRRLIISQLRSMDEAIRSLADRIEQQNEKGRDRISVFESHVQTGLSDLNVRIAMLEVRAKIWGGMIGFLGGAIASGVIDIVIGKVVK